GAHPGLAAPARLLDRELVEPVDGVYVAVGFALANVVALEGPDGLVIVDSTEGRPSAEDALAAIRTVTDKPIAALVLTHNHADHVFGGRVFVEDAARRGHPDIPIWAHASMSDHLDRVVNVLRDVIEVRSMRMFGTFLPPSSLGAGIGLRLRFRPQDIALARPDHTFEDEVDIEAGGLALRLLHVPGETDDQVAVWWPDRRVLLPADDIYQAFPNLYTIRGTPTRDVRAWVASLDRMRDLHAEVLVPQHTRPLVGAEQVEDTLTAYRDAIQYVHDQAVRGLNAGRTADELAATIRLPPHLASHPWLAERYGRVSWSVRSICDGYLGWFDGRGADLEPLAPAERGRRMMAAFSAGASLPSQARAALAAGDLQWAAELGQLWVDAEPASPEARGVLADALEGLGHRSDNANARNWVLTEAEELRGTLHIEPTPTDVAPVALVDGLPIDPFMQALSTRLRAEDVLDVDWQAVFEFTDIDRRYLVHVRRGVAEVRPRSPEQLVGVDADLTIRTTARTWKRIASQHEHALAAAARGDLAVDGDLADLVKLLRWFERRQAPG
ncbi:MAG: MBL fold metallo-hydrolase, partial [Deltaproteobacteria bacterium]